MKITASLLGALLGMTVGALALPGEGHARSSGPKRDRVWEIIIHATGGPFCQKGRVAYSPAGDVARMKRFFENSAILSIHYIVGRDGSIAASVPEDQVARHTRENNDGSVGIELINGGDGQDPYPAAQMAALVQLVHAIRMRWGVELDAVKGHEDVDPSTFRCSGRTVRRKQDPGPLFAWRAFKADVARLATGVPVAAQR